jgi:hypothetical protein
LQGDGLPFQQLRQGHVREGPGDRQDPAVFLQDPVDGTGGEQPEPAGLPQKEQPYSVVQLGIREYDALDGRAPDSVGRWLGETGELSMDIG